MAIACITSRAQIGLAAPLVHVEVHLGSGLPSFAIVGLPAVAVKESKERVRAALVNSRFEFPAGRITVNLAPADLPKEGCRFDLPIALGILAASGQLPLADEMQPECYGELGLDGELKSVRGLLPVASHAAAAGHPLIVPRANEAEAALVTEARVFGAGTLLEVCEHLAGRERLARFARGPDTANLVGEARARECRDLADVRGQQGAKRALLVAAAGAHSLLMIGPPGTGKSMLAQRLAGILPALPEDEALEVATLASVSGGFDVRRWRERPCRMPHHTASASAIVGGGPRAMPGEVSLAHRGVLFLDELPEFDRRVLEALREPLESGVISVSRANLRADYPAQFQFVAAMNPCPCGHHGDARRPCRCAPALIARYRSRVSGPLLDRIDLRVVVGAVTHEELVATSRDDRSECETSAAMAARVAAARARQYARAGKLNSALRIDELERDCVLAPEAKRLLAISRAKLGLSARAYHRALRVARTVADLDESERVGAGHVAEALQLRRAMSDGDSAAADH